MPLSIKTTILWDMKPRSLVDDTCALQYMALHTEGRNFYSAPLVYQILFMVIICIKLKKFAILYLSNQLSGC
jgi:hypothetical protein